ncbi:MAG: hypothetical protein JSS63_01330 [Bacteroidetes bacterium]|nr:hypothetical protein [Bacteroidota bacterium]
MPKVNVEVKFTGTPFDRNYITIEKQKPVLLLKTSNDLWKQFFDEIETYDDFFNFAFSSKGIIGDKGNLEIKIGDDIIKKYPPEEYLAENEGYIAIVDKIKIKK